MLAEFGTPEPGSAAALAWLIPVAPAVSAALLILLGKRIGRLAGPIAVGVAGFAAVLSTMVLVQLVGLPEEQRALVTTVATWISAGDLTVEWSLLLDPLSAVMLLLVTWVGLLIHIYSLGYMHGDPRYSRFFAYLNLFLASMLVLVLGESFLVLFVGWELVGLASYLLIGFWFENAAYASAAKKAFIVNRVGDVGFMIAMFLLFSALGTLAFSEALPQAGTLGTGTAVAVGLLLLVAAAGKSAQIPLYVWLPDAMAGPTPVSALIHAATMVTAGVYLVARVSPIYVTVPEIGMVVAWIGALTALLAALIACAQNDLKKILAYSTISQLGYMFIGVGLGAQAAGIFHLLTHGFFKALLFLAAGSVMHALADETDVFRMGGLRKVMPITFATSLVGWLAIAGLPPLSGFFSKEEVLVAALDTPGAFGIWVVGTVVAGLTAFYMSRWFFLIFLGDRRWEAPAAHAPAAGGPAGAQAAHAGPHESPLSMTVPLIVLAVGAALGGLINVTPVSLLRFWSPQPGLLEGWLEPSVVTFVGDTAVLNHTFAAMIVLVTGLAGVGVAVALYLRPGVDPALVRERLGGFYTLARDRFYVDELYQRTVERPGRLLADGFEAFDRTVIDGAVNGIGQATAGLGSAGRRLQTGFVRSYALAVAAGTVLVAVILLGGLYLGQG